MPTWQLQNHALPAIVLCAGMRLSAQRLDGVQALVDPPPSSYSSAYCIAMRTGAGTRARAAAAPKRLAVTPQRAAVTAVEPAYSLER